MPSLPPSRAFPPFNSAVTQHKSMQIATWRIQQNVSEKSDVVSAVCGHMREHRSPLLCEIKELQKVGV